MSSHSIPRLNDTYNSPKCILVTLNVSNFIFVLFIFVDQQIELCSSKLVKTGNKDCTQLSYGNYVHIRKFVFAHD